MEQLENLVEALNPSSNYRGPAAIEPQAYLPQTEGNSPVKDANILQERQSQRLEIPSKTFFRKKETRTRFYGGSSIISLVTQVFPPLGAVIYIGICAK
jgi:hypothetical protein